MSGAHKIYAETGKPPGYAKGGKVKGGKVKMKKEVELSVPGGLGGVEDAMAPPMPASPAMPPAPALRTMKCGGRVAKRKNGGRAGAYCSGRGGKSSLEAHEHGDSDY